MKNQTDPVVKDLTNWINRSAGQNHRRISEGAASARRICQLQTEEEAENLKQWQAKWEDGKIGMHRIDTSQMGQRDGVSVGACRTDLPVQFAEPAPEAFEMSLVSKVLLYAACAVLLFAALAATAPELVLMLLGVI